jgi:hypothetical protein
MSILSKLWERSLGYPVSVEPDAPRFDAGIDELRKDAQRYRWIRTHPNNMLPEIVGLDGVRLDRFIDRKLGG